MSTCKVLRGVLRGSVWCLSQFWCGSSSWRPWTCGCCSPSSTTRNKAAGPRKTTENWPEGGAPPSPARSGPASSLHSEMCVAFVRKRKLRVAVVGSLSPFFRKLFPTKCVFCKKYSYLGTTSTHSPLTFQWEMCKKKSLFIVFYTVCAESSLTSISCLPMFFKCCPLGVL